MILEDFLNGLNWRKFENRKMAKTLVNSVSSGLFGHSKSAKLSRVSRYHLEILYIYLSTSVLSHMFWLVENPKIILGNFGNKKKNIFLNFKIGKYFKIRDCSLIAMFNLHLLLKTNRFYLLKLYS